MDQLNIKDTMSIMNYGVNIQNMISELSDCAFDLIKEIDLSYVGDLLSEMLKYFKAPPAKDKTFLEIEHEIDGMTDKLKECRLKLLKDCELLEQLCVVNRTYIEQIVVHVEHARAFIDEAKQQPMTSDDKLRLGTMEKRIKELEMSQTVAYSFEPQLKVIQENEAQMAEKIQSTLVNALILWKRTKATRDNKGNMEETTNLVMEKFDEIIRLQREGYSVVDKS